MSAPSNSFIRPLQVGPWVMPPLACDAHMHVFGDPDIYPAAAVRSYTPREATIGAWRDVAQNLGLRRVVVVQPSAYGTDNSCVVDTLREIGPAGRGVVQIDPAADRQTLDRLHAAGIRGVRLNPKSAGSNDVESLKTLIARTAQTIAPLGWHLQLYVELPMLAHLTQALHDAAVPFVLDHMGGARAGDAQAALAPLLRLLDGGQCWVKLSGAYRVSRHDDDFADSTPIARTLVAANPDRLVWGTDWPHTAPHAGNTTGHTAPIDFRALDDRALLGLLAEACDSQATLTKILQDNPTKLYGF